MGRRAWPTTEIRLLKLFILPLIRTYVSGLPTLWVHSDCAQHAYWIPYNSSRRRSASPGISVSSLVHFLTSITPVPSSTVYTKFVASSWTVRITATKVIYHILAVRHTHAFIHHYGCARFSFYLSNKGIVDFVGAFLRNRDVFDLLDGQWSKSLFAQRFLYTTLRESSLKAGHLVDVSPWYNQSHFECCLSCRKSYPWNRQSYCWMTWFRCKIYVVWKRWKKRRKARGKRLNRVILYKKKHFKTRFWVDWSRCVCVCTALNFDLTCRSCITPSSSSSSSRNSKFCTSPGNAKWRVDQ